MESCRKKKTDDNTSFLTDLKDHIDEFVNASVDEHKTCFTKTIQKMFGMSKVIAERNSNSSSSSSSGSHAESHLPLQTSVTDSA
ncbi:hypothetical protein ZOSMA_94G00560 [Zostera marina]|uniref:Uncharacterized protein n=1 Tax=Zostera marina TaxID=29655 RepID=A0A0K9NKM9_ZOSMR|nr:hypothetical protein ZOSMA_94G00560 [Zostera marina]